MSLLKHKVLTTAQLSTVSQTTTQVPLSPLQPCWRSPTGRHCTVRGRSGSKTKLFTTIACRSLVLKCGTTLLNISLLFIHVRINIPAILPLDHHWNNLATIILNQHTLHSRDNVPIFLVLLVILTQFTCMEKLCTLIPELY